MFNRQGNKLKVNNDNNKDNIKYINKNDISNTYLKKQKENINIKISKMKERNQDF